MHSVAGGGGVAPVDDDVLESALNGLPASVRSGSLNLVYDIVHRSMDEQARQPGMVPDCSFTIDSAKCQH